MALREALAPFRMGGTELFLPDFTITFLRTNGSPANTAKFHVPLWFSKLDLRDYLFNVYNVRILNVRSYVKQSRVQEGKGATSKPTPGRWHRPRARKFMTVELERPFLWPERPKDYSDWNKREMEDSEKEQKEMNKQGGREGPTLVNEDRRKAMKEQAQALLDGKMKWRPMTDKKSGALLNR